MWIVNMTHSLHMKRILQVNQKSCQFQELKPNTCFQLESLAEKAFHHLHTFMEEMFKFRGTQMITHIGVKISVDQATMGIVFSMSEICRCAVTTIVGTLTDMMTASHTP